MTEQFHSGLLGDFHVHSQWSDDARSTIAENIAAAAEVGLTELRLVDHVRRSTPWIPEFLADVARQPCPDGLTLYTGVETKIVNSSGELDLPTDLTIGAGGVDAVVIADHQFPGPDGPWSPQLAREKLASGLSSADATDLLIGAARALLLHPSQDRARRGSTRRRPTRGVGSCSGPDRHPHRGQREVGVPVSSFDPSRAECGRDRGRVDRQPPCLRGRSL